MKTMLVEAVRFSQQAASSLKETMALDDVLCRSHGELEKCVAYTESGRVGQVTIPALAAKNKEPQAISGILSGSILELDEQGPLAAKAAPRDHFLTVLKQSAAHRKWNLVEIDETVRA